MFWNLATKKRIEMIHWVGQVWYLTYSVSCSVLQCAAVCCSVWQCVAVSGSELQFVSPYREYGTWLIGCVAVCCSVWQCVEVRLTFSRIWYMIYSVCCTALQCVAVCCNTLLCVAVCCSVWHVNTYMCKLMHWSMHSYVHARVCVCVCVCCCVCVAGRERAGERAHTRKRENACESKRERERVCVLVCMCATLAARENTGKFCKHTQGLGSWRIFGDASATIAQWRRARDLSNLGYPQVPGSIPAENPSTQINMDLSQ